MIETAFLHDKKSVSAQLTLDLPPIKHVNSEMVLFPLDQALVKWSDGRAARLPLLLWTVASGFVRTPYALLHTA